MRSAQSEVAINRLTNGTNLIASAFNGYEIDYSPDTIAVFGTYIDRFRDGFCRLLQQDSESTALAYIVEQASATVAQLHSAPRNTEQTLASSVVIFLRKIEKALNLCARENIFIPDPVDNVDVGEDVLSTYQRILGDVIVAERSNDSSEQVNKARELLLMANELATHFPRLWTQERFQECQAHLSTLARTTPFDLNYRYISNLVFLLDNYTSNGLYS